MTKVADSTPANVVPMVLQNPPKEPEATKQTPPAPTPAPTPTPTTVAKGVSVIGPQHDIPEGVDQLLVDILVFPRSHQTVTELEFQGWLTRKLNDLGVVPTKRQMDVLTVEIDHPPRPGETATRPSTTLFSCHTDTVDSTVPAGMRKKLTYDPVFGEIALDNTSCGGSLGADDGVGVWIMLKMIEAKIPGGYIFHRAEECGGLSAKAMANHDSKWINSFDVSVAFDRPRTSEIITHQRGQTECASNKFAEAVCLALNAHGMDFHTSKQGVYTDNYEYRKLIAENINVGVGYEGQHGRTETLDYAHAFALLNAVLKVNWDAMPVDRDNLAPDPEPAYSGYDYTKSSWYRDYRRDQMGLDDEFDGFPKAVPPKATKPAKRKGDKNGTKGYEPREGTKGSAGGKKDDPVVPAFDEAKWLVEEALGASAGDLLWICQEEPSEAHNTMVALIREVAKLRADVLQLRTLLGDA